MTTVVDAAPPLAQARRFRLILGGVVLAFGLYLSVFLVPDVIRTWGGPTTLPLADAAEVVDGQSHYVTITEGTWDCGSLARIRGRSSSSSTQIITRYTEVFLTGKGTTAALLAQFSGEVACADLPAEPAGYLTRMDAARQQELTNDARLARFFNADVFLDLCAYCGTSNSLIGAVVGVLVTLGGLVLLASGLRM